MNSIATPVTHGEYLSAEGPPLTARVQAIYAITAFKIPMGIGIAFAIIHGAWLLAAFLLATAILLDIFDGILFSRWIPNASRALQRNRRVLDASSDRALAWLTLIPLVLNDFGMLAFCSFYFVKWHSLLL